MFDLFSNKPTFQNGRIEDAKVIASALQEAVLKHAVIELRLDKADSVYSTFLVPSRDEAGEDAKQTAYIFTAPLEPAIGNSMMRRSKEVHISFALGTQSFAATIQYVQSVIMPDSALHQLTPPTQLLVTTVRKASRAEISPSMNIAVNVSLKRDRLFSSRVVDISGTGMMFENPMPEDALPVDTILLLEIVPMNISKLYAVEVHGQVKRHVKMRRDKSGASVVRMIGVRFMKFSDEIEKMAEQINKLHEKELQEARKHKNGEF